MNDNDALFEIVNKNSDYLHIADYIEEHYDINLNREELIEIAKTIINIDFYTARQVLNGEADFIIKKHIREVKMKTNSVLRKNEERKKSPLKTIKENIKKHWLTYLLAGTIAVSATFAFSRPKEEPTVDLTTSQMLGLLVAKPGTDEEIHKQSIVAQNTHHVPGVLDKNGYPIPFYDNAAIAKDILDICSDNDELFDMCMNSVYSSMTNRLANMDVVIKYIQSYSEDKEELKEINEKVTKNPNTLSYILSTGLVEPTDEMFVAIKKCIEVGYGDLSSKEQNLINKFGAMYIKAGEKLQLEYNDDLENMLGQDGENFGSRTN